MHNLDHYYLCTDTLHSSIYMAKLRPPGPTSFLIITD